MCLSFTCRRTDSLIPPFHSKAELIRCQTHGEKNNKNMGGSMKKKRKTADKGGAAWVKLETCPSNMSCQAERVLSLGERRWPAVDRQASRGSFSRSCLISALSFPHAFSLCGFDAQLETFRHALSLRHDFYLLSGGTGTRWDTCCCGCGFQYACLALKGMSSKNENRLITFPRPSPPAWYSVEDLFIY